MVNLSESSVLAQQCSYQIGECATRSEHDSTATLCTENSSISVCKQLRFSDDEPLVIAYIPLVSELDFDERKAIWWNSQDYHVFQDTAASISKEVRKRASFTNEIDEALKRAQHIASQLSKDEDDMQLVLEHLRVDEVRDARCMDGWFHVRFSRSL